jgi:hypothetical protein
LVEQCAFDTAVPSAQRAAEGSFIEMRIQRISRYVSNRCRHPPTRVIGHQVICEQSPKGALIDKPKFALSIHIESDTQVSIIGVLGCHKKQLAAHPKMRHERLIAI